MNEWWVGLAERWDWEDPILFLACITVLVTALIPVFVWRLGVKQSSNEHKVREVQAASLSRQERIAQRQRRDNLLSVVDQSSDETHLRLLWIEVLEFQGKDGELLRAAFRSNVSVSLPGSHTGGIKIEWKLDDKLVADYVAGLERRYSTGERGFHAYPGLLEFLREASDSKCKIDCAQIARLVTGKTVENQRPGHQFYRDLVNVLPETAALLLYRVEDIDYRNSGGSRLNVLTGALLGIKDFEIDRILGPGAAVKLARETIRSQVPVALAQLMHRNNLRSFDRWSLEGATEPVSATVAWLIRAVGWLADTDDHLALRMIQNLPDAIRSIPQDDRSWGIDKDDVQTGFQSIMEKQPDLWLAYGTDLQAAAEEVSL